jgi:hypothetical protein
MRTSYVYYFNNQKVSRKELLAKLKQDCQRVIHTDYAGDIGIDLMELDEVSYKENIKSIDKGVRVYFMKSKNCYYRKVR